MQNALDPEIRKFLEALYRQAGGDPGVQVSMYEVGAALGLDREASTTAAQDLMGAGLAEIRTLSGGIGLTGEGAALFDEASGPRGLSLGKDPVLDAPRIEAVQSATAQIRSAVASLGVPYDTLSDLVADLRTIEAQLTSSRPKTGVVRACLQSASRLGDGLPEGPWSDAVRRLLSDG